MSAISETYNRDHQSFFFFHSLKNSSWKLLRLRILLKEKFKTA